MSHHWPRGVARARAVLDVEDRIGGECAGMMCVCDHRYRRIFTLQGAWQLVCKLVHCARPVCAGHHQTFSPESELSIAPPFWATGWDVFCWIGHRRLARHGSVPQIRGELADSYGIDLSDDAIEKYIRRYQTMLAARHQDPQLLGKEYRNVRGVVLAIDGLQPEKGHETLYGVRERSLRRVWFAESLISSSAAEIQRLLELARAWAQRLGKPVRACVSDKQEAFVGGIAEVFPGVPHRYCRNHFLRDAAKPVLEIDSTAKVQMRSKVRSSAEHREGDSGPGGTGLDPGEEGIRASQPGGSFDARGRGGANRLDSGAGGFGLLHGGAGDSQQRSGRAAATAGAGDGPEPFSGAGLDPAKPEREKRGPAEKHLKRLAGCIDRGLEQVKPELATMRRYRTILRAVAATLEQGGKRGARQFEALQEELAGKQHPVFQHMARVMEAWSPGLFAGQANLPEDNLDWERWFRLPKEHERRIHGHAHAGVRLVQEGPTLIPALDAHALHPEPFDVAALLPFQEARVPASQVEALHRRRIMRQARSESQRRLLLYELAKHYVDSA